MAAKRLKPYFQAHLITVVSSAPLAGIIGSRDASGRVAKWAIEIANHGIQYEPRTTIKLQALADFLVDWAETQYAPPAPGMDSWRMHFDGSKMKSGLGAGVVLTSPRGDQLHYVLQIYFAASNKVAEYEALVHGIKLAKEIGIRNIECQEAVYHAISRIRVHLHLGNRLGNTAAGKGSPIGKNLNSEEATRRPRCSGLSRASSTRGCRSHTRGCRMQQKEESQRKESRSST